MTSSGFLPCLGTREQTLAKRSKRLLVFVSLCYKGLFVSIHLSKFLIHFPCRMELHIWPMFHGRFQVVNRTG